MTPRLERDANPSSPDSSQMNTPNLLREAIISDVMNGVEAMNVTEMCWTEWRVAGDSKKRQPKYFHSPLGKGARKQKGSADKEEGTFKRDLQGGRISIRL